MCVSTRRRISFFWLIHWRARKAEPSRVSAGTASPPALAVDPPVAGPPRPSAEPLPHLPAVFGLRPAPPAVAPVQREHRRADLQPLPPVGVVVFGVVAPVPQQRVQRTAGRGRPSRGLELRRVLGGAAADVGRQEQMAGRLQDDRPLGPELRLMRLPGARRSSGWRGGSRSRSRRWPHAVWAGSGLAV